MAKVPGTLMPIQIGDDKTRADVIAYLATLKEGVGLRIQAVRRRARHTASSLAVGVTGIG